jgi:hypothetical protein
MENANFVQIVVPFDSLAARDGDEKADFAVSFLRERLCITY